MVTKHGVKTGVLEEFAKNEKNAKKMKKTLDKLSFLC